MSSHRVIADLIHRYTELVDDGDFAGIGDLLADATFVGGDTAVVGRKAIEQGFRTALIVYADGTPRTRHLVTNLIVDVDEEAGTAASRCYFTALQAVPGRPLEIIASGRYHDRFELIDGHWRFTERKVSTDLTGDLSRHLR